MVQLQARGTILHCSRLVDHKQRQHSITRHGELMGQSLALRPTPSKGFFVSREHHDFGTKREKLEIDSKGIPFIFREHDDFPTIPSRLRPASSNKFEKWPAKVKKLDHPKIKNELILFCWYYQGRHEFYFHDEREAILKS